MIAESRIDEQIENAKRACKALQKLVDTDSAALKPEIEAAENQGRKPDILVKRERRRNAMA